MSEVPIALVASKFRRTDYWVVVELQAAGIRNSPRFDPLTIEELESLVDHLKLKWSKIAAVTEPNTKPVRANSCDALIISGVRATADTHKLLPLTPTEKREIALTLLDIPDSVKALMLGQKTQFNMKASELRRISKKKSSSIPSHAQVIQFLRSSEFLELQQQLRTEANKAQAILARFHGLGVAAKTATAHTLIETNPMSILERLPLDWWREQE
jgi:hypothetical protein